MLMTMVMMIIVSTRDKLFDLYVCGLGWARHAAPDVAARVKLPETRVCAWCGLGASEPHTEQAAVACPGSRVGDGMAPSHPCGEWA